MQKIFFLLFVVGLLGCRNDELPAFRQAEQAFIKYHQLPEHFQKADLRELFSLSRERQKTFLEQAILEAQQQMVRDSLLTTYLKEPYYNFIDKKFRGAYTHLSLDSFYVKIEIFTHLANSYEMYSVRTKHVYYQKVRLNMDCVGLRQRPEFFSPKCIIPLHQKSKNLTPTKLLEFQNYLDKIGFESFPSDFHGDCMDGNGYTVFIKTRRAEKVFQVRCPVDLHPVQQVVNQVFKLLNE